MLHLRNIFRTLLYSAVNVQPLTRAYILLETPANIICDQRTIKGMPITSTNSISASHSRLAVFSDSLHKDVMSPEDEF